jgi:signal peptidase I
VADVRSHAGGVALAGSAETRAPGRLASVVGGVAAGAAVLLALFVVALGVGPRLLPYRAYVIESGSMNPTIPVGAVAVLRPVHAAELRVGDIITFTRPDTGRGLVTHRIVRIEGPAGARVLVTKGDANPVPDAWRVPVQGAGWRYAFQVPYAGYVVAVLNLAVVRLAAFGVVALLLGAAAVRRIWSPAAA